MSKKPAEYEIPRSITPCWSMIWPRTLFYWAHLNIQCFNFSMNDLRLNFECVFSFRIFTQRFILSVRRARNETQSIDTFTWLIMTVYKLVSITLRKITGTESILKTMLTLHHHYLSTRKRTAFPLRSNRENRSLYYILDPYMQVRNSLSLTFFSVTWCKMALSLPAS